MLAILAALAISLGDDRSYDWVWTYDFGNGGWKKGEMTLNPACLAFNTFELFTTPEERDFAEQNYQGIPITKRWYDSRTRITLDYVVNLPTGWTLALHNLPELGYRREIILAMMKERLHLFAVDHDDHGFHNYPIRR